MSKSRVSYWNPPPSTLLQTLRIGILLMVCSLHIALIIISALALSLRSGGGCQISIIVFGSITLFLVASFSLIQRLNPVPEQALCHTRRLFFIPWIVGFSAGVFFIFVARIPDGRLASEYASLGDLSTIVLVLGLFAALFACLLPFVYPFYYNAGSTNHSGTRSERSATERSVDVFDIEALPHFPPPAPLPLVYIDANGKWSYRVQPQPRSESQPQPQLQAARSAPPTLPSKQISSDPFFDVNLYELGAESQASGSGQASHTQWPRINRFSSQV